jgi:hypothetical protein
MVNRATWGSVWVETSTWASELLFRRSAPGSFRFPAAHVAEGPEIAPREIIPGAMPPKRSDSGGTESEATRILANPQPGGPRPFSTGLPRERDLSGAPEQPT